LAQVLAIGLDALVVLPVLVHARQSANGWESGRRAVSLRNSSGCGAVVSRRGVGVTEFRESCRLPWVHEPATLCGFPASR